MTQDTLLSFEEDYSHDTQLQAARVTAEWKAPIQRKDGAPSMDQSPLFTCTPIGTPDQAELFGEVIAEGATFEVDPDRLKWEGVEDDDREGDIHASYSADKIAEKGSRIRKPFRFQGSDWCCTGIFCGEHTAYRLTPLSAWPGKATTYWEKLRIDDGDMARSDPMGFHHGMTVKHGGNPYVLTGPKVRFTPATSNHHHGMTVKHGGNPYVLTGPKVRFTPATSNQQGDLFS